MVRTSLLRGRRHYRRLRHRPAILQRLPRPLTLNGSNHQNSSFLPPAPGNFREWLPRYNNVMVGDGTTCGSIRQITVLVLMMGFRGWDTANGLRGAW
jgi:hypothetical protein